MGLPRAAWMSAVALVLVLAAAGPASAFQFDRCISATGAGPCTSAANTSALNLPSAVAVSPDGRFVYSTSFIGDAVSWFARDPAGGGLIFLGCLRGQDAVGPCGSLSHVRALEGPTALAISPDGKHVYVTAGAGDALSLFARNADTGALTYNNKCWTTNTDGGGVCVGLQSALLDGPSAVAVSPGGGDVFVTGEVQSSVGVFARNADTGMLTTPASCFGDAGACPDLAGGNAQLGGASALAVAPNGPYVYVAARNADAVSVFRTDQPAHTLTYVGCVAAAAVGNCTVVGNANALDGASGLAASPDGTQLYATAFNGNAVAAFTRNQSSGALSFAACRSATGVAPCTSIGNNNAVSGPTAIVVGAAGARVYSAAGSGDAIATFARGGGNPLAFLGCVGANASGPCASAANATAFNDPVSLAVSPDGRHLYAAARGGDALAVLNVAPPTCTPLAASTAFQTPVALQLQCSDPDGDPVGYSVGAAAHGSLSGLNSGAGSLVYSPLAGFSGADGFQFSGTSIDGTATRSASIAVGAPTPVTPPPPPPPPPLVRLTAPIQNRWAAGPTRTQILQLRVRLVPGNATVEVRCSAPKRLGRRACPFKRKSAKPKSDGATVELRGMFGKRKRLRVGVRIQIRITAPGAIGKVVTYKMRRSKIPRVVSRCLPPGASTPTAC